MIWGAILHKVVKEELTIKEIFEQRFEGNEHTNIRRKSIANNSIKVADVRLLGKHKQQRRQCTGV